MEKKIISAIKEGKIFVYPTDTVYGLGCNALNENSVKKIFEIKKTSVRPLSIIAHSKDWIERNCIIPSYINIGDYLPGPYTLILKKKKSCKIPSVVSANKNTLGVRIPKHDFTFIIQQAEVPFITTSANIHGEKAPASIKEIPKEILQQVDFVIDAGKLKGKPSKIIDTTSDKMKVVRK